MKVQNGEVIARGMNFPMKRVLDRYTLDYLASREDAESLERELKRYLILFAINPQKGYPMAGPVDDLWHTFLLFTQQYAQFCQQVAGHFIHHVPADPAASPAQLRQWQEDYATFLTDYETVFGEPAPSSIWPTLEAPPPGRKKTKNQNGQSTKFPRKKAASS